jgi:MoaA/NifB/PqqE/SkfB family radical SAM enzyme
MTVNDWLSLIDQAAADGVNMIQFIGGEPTLAPGFTGIVRHALDAGLDVEVYSNLVHVTDEMWELFRHPRLNLAFSYYSSSDAVHNAVTQRPTHGLTRRNALKAVSLGIRIRAGVIDFGDKEAAVADLKSMGITKITTDRVREIGRGGGTEDTGELCGHCGEDVAAVSADGDVTPCILSRWMARGNVHDTSLGEILASPEWSSTIATLPRRDVCDPNQECPPGFPPSSCDPRN